MNPTLECVVCPLLACPSRSPSCGSVMITLLSPFIISRPRLSPLLLIFNYLLYHIRLFTRTYPPNNLFSPFSSLLFPCTTMRPFRTFSASLLPGSTSFYSIVDKLSDDTMMLVLRAEEKRFDYPIFSTNLQLFFAKRSMILIRHHVILFCLLVRSYCIHV